jgi:glycosyltransferase involved in cell wall biosynthesis
MSSAAYEPVHRVRNSDKRIRVLTLARDVGSGYGGAEKVAFEFVRRLDEQRFKSYLCTTRAPHHTRVESVARDRRELDAQGIEVLDLGRESHHDVLPWRHVYSLMVRERIDIVHAHMPRASGPGAVLARLARVPVVISHEHGSALEGKIGRRIVDRLLVAPLSTRMLAVSEWDRRNIIELEGIAPERIEVLPNGIPVPREDGPDVRPELGVPAGVPLVGAVGRLFPEKGYDDLMRAVAVLRDRGRELRCVVVGDGREAHEEVLRALIPELGIEREMSLAGRRSDIPDVIRAFDVAVLPSKREGSPLAMLEYMAAGAPIVATSVGGVPELITDGESGLLVPPDDPAALADAIDRLLGDRELAQRLGRAAKARQRAQYDLDVVVHRLEQMYVELLSRARGR